MKAVPDNYQARPMHVLCQEALEMLREADGQPLRCGYIGSHLFWAATHRGSAPFARIAGKVVRRLDRAGLAVSSISHGYGGWVVTAAGRRCNYHG